LHSAGEVFEFDFEGPPVFTDSLSLILAISSAGAYQSPDVAFHPLARGISPDLLVSLPVNSVGGTFLPIFCKVSQILAICLKVWRFDQVDEFDRPTASAQE